MLTSALYPQWLHRQCVCLAYPWTPVRAPAAAASLAICSTHLHRSIRGAQGVLPMRVGDVTSLSNLAGCRRLKLGVRLWATSVITASS